VEGAVGLADWIGHCLRLTRPGGSFTMIHRYDRLGEIEGLLDGRVDALCVFPLWPKAQGIGAKRVLIQSRNAPPEGETRVARLDGLVLHREDGAYTAEAEEILRRAGPCALGGRRPTLGP